MPFYYKRALRATGLVFGGKVIMIPTPPQWIKIVQTKSLYPDKKLPMQIDIEATGAEWGKTLSAKLEVRLDESEASIKIELSTPKKR